MCPHPQALVRRCDVASDARSAFRCTPTSPCGAAALWWDSMEHHDTKVSAVYSPEARETHPKCVKPGVLPGRPPPLL